MIPGSIIAGGATLLRRVWPYALAVGLIAGAWAYADHRGYARAEAKYSAALAELTAEIRATTAAAKAEDLAHARVVELAQSTTSEEVSRDYQARIADLRARYERLRAQANAHPGGGGGAHLPGLPDAPGGPDATPPQDRLTESDALTASEQALQLDALIQWVERQRSIER